MELTKKERTQRTLEFKPVDHLPTQISYTEIMGQIIAGFLNISTEELPSRLNNHIIRVDATDKRTLRADGKVVYDWWGVGFDTQEEGYFVAESPLAEDNNLDKINWPDPHALGLFNHVIRTIDNDQASHFIIPNLGFALFERAWALRGFENLLMDMLLDPGYVEELLDRITEIQQVLIKKYIQLGVDGGYFGDDYGTQNNLLFSSQIWRKMIKPRLQQLFAPFRQAGLPVIMHSDGQIMEILAELVEIGLTCYNPVQPEVIEHSWLKKIFGTRLAYYGGISTQTVLPYGSPDDVKRSVEECVEVLASNGTGLLIAPSHRLMSDIPMENIAALLDAFAQLAG